MSNAIFKLENHYINYNKLRSYDGDDIDEVVEYIQHLEQRLAEVEEENRQLTRFIILNNQ